ncbi:hypothetical protein imdm_121 [gamma proteobacterium IMCC2047]|nr:hypothetical protein imdm_121 [gamma proteobacterium IMCC2047]
MASYGGNEFIDIHGLGNTLDHTNINVVAKSLDRWLSLSNEEQDQHSRQAHNFARQNLSVEGALNKRLEFWSKKIYSRN